MDTPTPLSLQHRDPDLFDDKSFDLDIAGPDALPRFRAALEHANAVMERRFEAQISATALVHQRAWVIDQLLLRAWRRCMPSASSDIALVAVGGYGRGELHPGSDIDILILLKTGAADDRQDAIGRFVVFLWDIGLEVGHSVRTVDECQQEAAADITVATTLMESRLLAGPKKLFALMRECTGPDSVWPSRDFFAAKRKEQAGRHHKYGDTGYQLEPNIKESPGGLRDIQMIGWVAKRHFRADNLASLVQHGFLTHDEYTSLVAGQDHLWRIRIALHGIAGRREDRLLFDHQRALADRFGFHDEQHHLAVEQFMRRYYQTVMELSRLNEMLLQLFEEAILHADMPIETTPLNSRFKVSNGFIEVQYERVFHRYPFALLEMFLLLAQNPSIKGVRAATIRLVRAHNHLIDAGFRNDLRNRTLFMELLRQPHGVTHELRRMNRYGVLAAYLPAFGRVVGLMQYDLFHVYTVDEHTLTVIRNMRRFSVPELSTEFPLCSEIHRRLPKPELLYLAGLFHDIAKGRGGDHSDIGADEAAAFCSHHGLSQYDTRLVTWLVKHHLILSMTAQRKDISDPEVINAFAAKVGDLSHLDYLYLLTVADIRGTNPALWNSWKDALLRELYLFTRRALARGLENPIDKLERISETQTEVKGLLAQERLSEAALNDLWKTLEDDYFLHHSPDEIASHSRAILKCAPEELPLILVRGKTQRGGTEIFIYTHDQDFLFANTTRVLDQLNLSIVDARLITTRGGLTLDTYIVLDESGEPVTDQFRIEELRNLLRAQISASHPAAKAVTRRSPRLLKHFPIRTNVDFDVDARNARAVMSLTTADRPGLLHLVSQALLKCNVELKGAKIATLGAHVEDVFFITDKKGRPVDDPTTFECLSKAIVDALDRPN